MTFEELKRLVLTGDRESLCNGLANLAETERKELADKALLLFQKVDSNAFGVEEADPDSIEDPDDAEIVRIMKAQDFADWRIPRLAAGLAILGLCDQKVLGGNLGAWFSGDMRDMPQRVLQVLSDRRPKWLAAWVAKQVKQEYPVFHWYVERGLIRAGALPQDTSDAYIDRMAETFPNFVHGKRDFEVTTDCLPDELIKKSLKDALLADPDLLSNEIWRLFEVETRAFAYDHSGWRKTLCQLSEEGHIDRARLLQACVEAMALPFRKQTLSGYIKLHDELSPTLDERETLASAYLTLLGCENPQVVGCAVTAAELLAKAKRLDTAAFLEACPAAMQLANKTQPRKIIKLAAKFLKADAGCAPHVTKAVAGGLGNTSPDVQEDALALLETLRDHIPPDVQDELGTWRDHVAAALQSRVDALLEGPAGAESATSAPSSVSPSADSSDLADLQNRAAALDEQLRLDAGVDEALKAITDGSDPNPAVIDPRYVPHRDPNKLVTPIESLEELIDTVSAVVERVDDVIDIERILDGICRFHIEKPDDFEKRVAALKKRLLETTEAYSDTVAYRGAETGFTQVLFRWLDLPPLHHKFGRWYDLADEFSRMRMSEIAERMDRRPYGREDPGLPLLSLPTHAEGWLDPVALVNRIKRYEEEGGAYRADDTDLAVALLRMTPDGRDEAAKLLPTAKRVERVWGILRFALGRSDKLRRVAGFIEGDLTIAALHARRATPDVDDYDPPFTVPEFGMNDDGTVHFSGPVADDPAFPRVLLALAHSWRPSARDEEGWGTSPYKTDWIAEWRNTIWPFDRRGVCLLGSLWNRNSPAYLQNLFARDMTWHDEAALLAILAAGSENTTVRGLVTDALIDAIADCQVPPALLGRHFAAQNERLKLNRVAGVFAEVAKVSPLHHWAAFTALETYLGVLATAPRDLHHVLTVVLESATVIGKTLNDEAATLLKSLKGSSKTAKLGKQLLTLDPAPDRMQPVRMQAFGATVERAERWAAIHRGTAP